LEIAAQEELKITELRLAKLFASEPVAPPSSTVGGPTSQSDKAAAPEITGSSNRTRPPITTHVLDVARGSPASGIEVHLEMWKDAST
ncbi:hydroxyisourate hydrolase, partial [Shewanella sp. A3A]|nr:hydroxyisourate hydrolase [Shewanella ferrihydritica]